jgi:hypothetical protein
LELARKELQEHLDIPRTSAIYQTPPWGYESSEDYLNQALPLTRTLQQSRYYAKFRMLSDAKLFLEDEAPVFRSGSAISADTFTALQKQSLSQLPVVAEL